MTTYTVLTDAEILADEPITQGQGRAFRDNPLAIAEGDATAPRIQLGAIDFGSDADGAFTDGSSAPTLPGFYDYSSFLRTTPVSFPAFSYIRVQGNFTLSSTLTVASQLTAADQDLLRVLGVALGHDGAFDSGSGQYGGGGSEGAGGSTGAGAASALASLKRFWLTKRGFAGGRGGLDAIAPGVTKPGGSIVIVVTGDVDLSGGTIAANGLASTGTVAGGGGGGSIIIVARGFIRAGTLQANGGAALGFGGAPAGGGGGGRVETSASSYPIAQTISVTAGAGHSGGAAGTAGSSQQDTLTAAQILGLLYR